MSPTSNEQLVEALANVLYDAFCRGPRFRQEYPDNPEIWRWTLARITGDRDGSAEMHREPWRQAAREALRQMEWARQETLKDCEQPFEPPLPPLTLAPEDWVPNGTGKD